MYYAERQHGHALKTYGIRVELESGMRTAMGQESEGIRLADAIEMLRSEVALAQVKAAGNDLQFPVETLTVELKVELTKYADGKAGFRVPFVGAELGGSAAYQRETMQTVTLVLGSPVDRDGNPVKVAAATDVVKG
jgi:hypothetical protein